MKPKPIPARQLDEYRGKKYFAFTVLVVMENLDSRHETTFRDVIAVTAADAVELIRGEYYKAFARNPSRIHPLNFYSWGVKGGMTYRFSGWESCIGGAMRAQVKPIAEQIEFTL